MIRAKKLTREIVIDLNGPEGNAFCLIDLAKKLARRSGYSSQKIIDLVVDMMSSDYEHLITVFDNHFGDIVILER